MTMMEWTENMSVGVAQFHDEHRKLVGLINNLFEALQAGRGRQALGSMSPVTGSTIGTVLPE